MAKVIQLKAYGGVERLEFADRPIPAPAQGQVVVRVVAAGINPGEIGIREGVYKDRYPRAFPFGQGTDLAGRVEAAGAGVTAFAPGDEVMGWTDDRASHAEYVVVPPENLIRKPTALDWYRAGSLAVTGRTACAAIAAVDPKPGETIAISGAAGGVGSLAIQLARRRGARVLGIASAESADFSASLGVEPIAYGDGLADRLRAAAPGGIDAFVDLFGGGYVDLALELGVAKARIDTIFDFAAAQRYGIETDGYSEGSPADFQALADLIAWGDVLMPLAAIYPFDRIHDAYRELAKRKSRGKIVLAIDPPIAEPLFPPTRS